MYISNEIANDERKQETHKKIMKSLPQFKQTYEFFRKKYSLPEYEFMNETFEIEILCEIETELFLKRIRKQVAEKISAGLRTLEMFLNAQNAPLFVFNIIKSFDASDKEVINGLYRMFAEFEIEAFSLENKYDEKKEAEFIKKVCSKWQNITEDMSKINEAMFIGFKKDPKSNEKSYFG